MKRNGALRRVVILVAFCWAYFTYVIWSNQFNWSQEVRNGLTVLLILSVIWGIVTVIADRMPQQGPGNSPSHRTDDDVGF